MISKSLGSEWALAACASLAFVGCASNAGTPSPSCTRSHGLVSRPAARIFLTQALIDRLRARAAAGEASWTKLAQSCDSLASGTVNPPSGPAYPNKPDVGSGYQGEDYLPAVAALGLCYRTASGLDDVAAARYGTAGARVLDAMATPPSSGGQPPQTDSGYGIRNYAVGMALGYDWLYPGLTSSTRQRVVDSVNLWVDWYDASGFIKNDPIGNYFVGYLLAKTLTGLATEGDNPKAAGYFADVQDRLWGKLTLPAFQRSMVGGGWPEGWGYGPRAVLSVAQTLWAVKTAKGLDWEKQVPQVHDQAAYLRYFAWPSLTRMDDPGTVRSGTALQPSARLATGLATILQRFGDSTSPSAVSFGTDVAASAGDDRSSWEQFLYSDPALPTTAYTSAPLSYYASGPGHVAMRSAWTKRAVWGALHSGAYINAAYSGEQGFEAGGLSVVVGGAPLLVNATGWIPKVAGTAGEDFVYEDSWGSGKRRLYNTFFVDDSTNPGNPGQNSASPNDSSTRVERYDEGGAYLRARAANVEDMYGAPGGVQPIAQFTRDVVYLRPGTFVLYDRTTATRAGVDQWLAFHTAAAPVRASTSDTTQVRFDVSSPSGSINVLLPKQVSPKTVALPDGVARLEAHAPNTSAPQTWLSVVVAGTTPVEVRLSSSDGNVLSGGVLGVQLRGIRNQVVLFPADHSPTATAPGAEYVVSQTADADHVLVDLAQASDGYGVQASGSAGALTIRVARGGPFRVSAAGTLHFVVTQSGEVQGAARPGTGGAGGAAGSGGEAGAGSSGGAGGAGSSSGTGGAAAGDGGTPPAGVPPHRPPARPFIHADEALAHPDVYVATEPRPPTGQPADDSCR